jgi:hypothetical protein
MESPEWKWIARVQAGVLIVNQIEPTHVQGTAVRFQFSKDQCRDRATIFGPYLDDWPILLTLFSNGCAFAGSGVTVRGSRHARIQQSIGGGQKLMSRCRYVYGKGCPCGLEFVTRSEASCGHGMGVLMGFLLCFAKAVSDKSRLESSIDELGGQPARTIRTNPFQLSKGCPLLSVVLVGIIS